MSSPANRAPLPRRIAWMESDPAFTGLLLVLVVFLAYVAGAMLGSFHFDDYHNAAQNEHVTTLANVPRFFTDASTWSAEPGNTMYRPVLMTSYALDHAVWGLRASGWLLTNLLLHAAVTVLVWSLARRLGLSPLAAFLAGLVHGLHPVHSEVVNYVSSRSESLAALLALGAVHLHLSSAARSGGARAAFAAGAALLGGLSLLAKETTALLFAAVALLEVVRTTGRPAGERVRRVAAAALPLAVVFAAAMFLRGQVLAHATAPVALVTTAAGADHQAGGTISILDNVLKVQSRVVVLYLQTLLRPVALNVDHDVSRAPVWTASAAAALALHAAVAAWALRDLRRGRRLLPLCVGWFWLFLAPSVAFPLNVVMNEHRLYLPGIAVALLAGAALARVAALLRPRFGAGGSVAVAAAPLVLFLPLVLQRSFEWRSDEALWEAAVRRAPDSARAHMHYGAALHAQANRPGAPENPELLRRAIRSYMRSRDIHPRDSQTLLNLGSACIDLGRATSDAECFVTSLGVFDDAARVMGPSASRPRLLKAVALGELGRTDEAVAILRDIRAADPSTTALYDDLLARILRKAGRKADAEAAMRRVIQIEEPLDRVDGLVTLCWWNFEDGDVAAAKTLLERALAASNRARVAGSPASFLPYLYAARMMRLLGLRGPDADREVGSMIRLALETGWSAPADEARWVDGGPTPGAIRGTRGIPAYGLR